ncbi:MAG: cryptochrome/photolyase family protein [Rhodospirillaceae bacterium]
MACRILRVIAGDQLSRGLSALSDIDATSDVVLMAEVFDEATVVRHHRKKLAFQFSAMRHFAVSLENGGIDVDYVRLDDSDNSGSLRTELVRAVKRHQPERIVLTCPGEYRVARDVAGWSATCGVPVELREDTRFFCSRTEFTDWAGPQKPLRFAPFYRELRRRTGLLMSRDGTPEGNRWHHRVYHTRTRRTPDLVPPGLREEPDTITRTVLDLVARRFSEHFGDLEPFWFAVDQAGAERAFDYCRSRLLTDGPSETEDTGDARAGWAVIALYLNTGLLDPRAVCVRIEADYRRGQIPLGKAEAVIRLVLGWREFYRGVYWLRMPAYADLNHFNAYGPLPDFYWSGGTEMACMHHAIEHGRRHAFTDHVSRLGITGNFALLAGVAPREISEWQRAVYADAFEWADLPHAHGLVTFADGGLFTGQPHLASGYHMNRHFPFCDRCSYDVTSFSGERACPMNFLYWNFLLVNRDKLAGNRLMNRRYRDMERLSPDMVAGIRTSAEHFLNSLG